MVRRAHVFSALQRRLQSGALVCYQWCSGLQFLIALIPPVQTSQGRTRQEVQRNEALQVTTPAVATTLLQMPALTIPHSLI